MTWRPLWGVYTITNMRSGKTYVGCSVNIRDRWTQHRAKLKSGKHHNHELQIDWVNDGADAFSFLVIERILGRWVPSLGEIAERYWLDALRIEGIPLYNQDVEKMRTREPGRPRKAPAE